MKRFKSVPWAALKSGLIFADAGPADDRVAALRSRRDELVAANDKIVGDADEADGGAGRDLTETELERIQTNGAEIAKLDKQISARQSVQPQGQGRRTDSDVKPAAGSAARVVAGRDPNRYGFQSFGEFAQSVRLHGNSQTANSGPAQKLQNAATTYGNEGTGADGGFLVPPEFSRAIWKKVQGEQNLLTRCAQLQIGSNSIVIPKDEATPWQTTGGVQVYWQAEGAAITNSKPVFELSTIRLVKLSALVNVTEELLEDAIGLESWLSAKTPDKMVAKINTAIISGNGTGQPLGILNAPSLVTVSKEGSQTADTVNFPNIVKMYSRMYAPWVANSVWLINQDVLPQLFVMAFPNASGTVPAYMPANSMANAPFGMLMGRPVVPVEACAALGDLGDILFVDLNQYWAITRASGMRTETSMHLFFDQGIQSFRFDFRLNGLPAWASKITAQNGSSNERGWAIALEAR